MSETTETYLALALMGALVVVTIVIGIAAARRR